LGVKSRLIREASKRGKWKGANLSKQKSFAKKKLPKRDEKMLGTETPLAGKGEREVQFENETGSDVH